MEDFEKNEDVWGPVLKKVLDQGGENIDLAAEFAAVDTQAEHIEDSNAKEASKDDAPRGEKRTIDEVEK